MRCARAALRCPSSIVTRAGAASRAGLSHAPAQRASSAHALTSERQARRPRCPQVGGHLLRNNIITLREIVRSQSEPSGARLAAPQRGRRRLGQWGLPACCCAGLGAAAACTCGLALAAGGAAPGLPVFPSPHHILAPTSLRAAAPARAGHKSNNDKGSIYMVFDYMEHDMTGLLQRVNLSGRHFKPAEVRRWGALGAGEEGGAGTQGGGAGRGPSARRPSSPARPGPGRPFVTGRRWACLPCPSLPLGMHFAASQPAHPLIFQPPTRRPPCPPRPPRPPRPQLKCILKQLFYGLALLVQKKILHRDLKNSNLLLNNRVRRAGGRAGAPRSSGQGVGDRWTAGARCRLLIAKQASLCPSLAATIVLARMGELILAAMLCAHTAAPAPRCRCRRASSRLRTLAWRATWPRRGSRRTGARGA